LFSIFVILMLPTVNAVEYQTTQDAKYEYLINLIYDFNQKDFDFFEQLDVNQLISLIKINKNGFSTDLLMSELKQNILETSPQPQCFLMFLSLIAILRACFNIVNFIFSIISGFLDLAWVILEKIISSAITLIKTILKIIIVFLIIYVIVTGVIDIFFLFVYIIKMILGIS
ncbi:MAG: hypothetical protein JXA91_01900, partial [Candidatus Thermoplasmatota archaeon]|nr:hypothetical protein [Candidatus Thermoplasmatota archaeon]